MTLGGFGMALLLRGPVPAPLFSALRRAARRSSVRRSSALIRASPSVSPGRRGRGPRRVPTGSPWSPGAPGAPPPLPSPASPRRSALAG